MARRCVLTGFLPIIALAVACTTVETGGGETTTPPPNTTTKPGATETVTKEPPNTTTRTVNPPREVQPTGQAASCDHTTSQPRLRRGATGPAVRQAQCYLTMSLTGGRGGGLPVDGEFGPVTDRAVRAFQECAGITVDGVIGPQTWPYLVYWAGQPAYLC